MSFSRNYNYSMAAHLELWGPTEYFMSVLAYPERYPNGFWIGKQELETDNPEAFEIFVHVLTLSAQDYKIHLSNFSFSVDYV